MFKVISGIMAQWYLKVNAFIITSNFYNEKNINCALMLKHNGRIVLSSLIELE